jgi:hypothetical protein
VVCFREVPERKQQGETAESHQERKGGAPSVKRFQNTTDRGRDHRGDRHAHRDIADHASHLVTPIKVAEDGAAQSDPGAASDGLHDTPEDQEADTLRGEADERAHYKDSKANQEHGPSSEPVGKRPDDELPECHGCEIEREGQLNGGEIDSKRTRHAWHGGQVHIDAKWAHGRDRDEQSNKARFGDGLHLGGRTGHNVRIILSVPPSDSNRNFFAGVCLVVAVTYWVAKEREAS